MKTKKLLALLAGIYCTTNVMAMQEVEHNKYSQGSLARLTAGVVAKAAQAPQAGEAPQECFEIIDLQKLLARCGNNPSRALINICSKKRCPEYLVRNLLNAGADVTRAKPNGRTALHAAASRGHTAIVELLSLAGADVNVRAARAGVNDNNGVLRSSNHTPLHCAAGNGLTQVVELLIKHGAHIPQDHGETTPLHLAAFNGRQAVVETLLQHNAAINARSAILQTPLHLAAFKEHQAVVETLLQHGANINARDNNQRTPLHLAAEIGHQAIVETLLQHDAPIDAQNHQQAMPLHFAAFNGRQAVVEYPITTWCYH